MRIGYSCKHQTIEPKNKIMTFKKFSSLNKKQQIHSLFKLSENNLDSLENTILDNINNNIKLFRITSNLFPLTTHKDIVEWWDPVPLFQTKLEKIGKIINDNDVRVSMHPGQFTILTSDNDSIVKNAINELIHTYNILKTLQLKNTPDIVLHVGGKYNDTKSAIKNLIRNFNELPHECKQMIRFENDQKIYGTQEVYHICKFLNVPMILDIQHHIYNSNDISLYTAFNLFFDTWKSNIPKIHLSSQCTNYNNGHKHSEYVSLDDFNNIYEYLQIRDFDIMLECKKTNIALHKLREELKRNNILI